MRAVTGRWAEIGGRGFWGLAAIVLAIAAEARFLGLTDRSLWFDEAHSVYVTQSPFLQLLGLVAHTDTHPPLYYVLLKAWMVFFGSGEMAVRGLSAVCGFLMIPLLYGFVRRMTDRDVALAAAVLLAGSAFAARAAQEARMYPLLGLLALGSWAALRVALEQPRARTWIVYAATTALMLYTHYFGFLVFGSQTLFLIPRLWRDRRTLVAAAVAQAGALLLFLPWTPAFIIQVGSGRGWPTFRPPVGATAATDLFGLYSFGGELFGAAGYFHVSSLSPWMVLLLSAPFLVLAGAGFYALRGERAWCLACYLAVPVGAAIIVSQRTNIFYPRYFSFLAPAWAVLMGAGVDATARSLLRLPRLRPLGRPAIAIGLVVALLAANAPVINGYSYEGEDTYNWRAAAELVAAEAGPDDYLLFVPGFGEKAFEYYYKGTQERFQLWPVEIYQMVRIRKPPDPTVGKAWVRRLAETHPRVWIVGTVPFPPAAYLRLRTMLAAGFDGERAWDFHYVYVFELKSHLYTAKAKRP